MHMACVLQEDAKNLILILSNILGEQIHFLSLVDLCEVGEPKLTQGPFKESKAGNSSVHTLHMHTANFSHFIIHTHVQ